VRTGCRTVNVKYKDPWCGQLRRACTSSATSLTKLCDASTAIIGRVVLLQASHSWLAKEEQALEQALQAELLGILNWSLAGLHRLTIDNKNDSEGRNTLGSRLSNEYVIHNTYLAPLNKSPGNQRSWLPCNNNYLETC
jgi:hypothetical protein